jgi:general secretion pathway protein K
VSRARPGQDGIALMLVLWVLALLTIIAVGLTAAQRTESALASNQLDTARFHAAAEAGIAWAALNLSAPRTLFEGDVDPWIPDGSVRVWTFAGEDLEIRVVNEASLIDLNRASRGLLESLFAAVGLGEDQASALADAIEDWRDPDDLTQLNGAEDGDYEDAGRSYGAKDGRFDSVEELQLVLGVDQDLYHTLAPALTVDSGRSNPDPEFAPPLVQAALQGISLEEAQLKQQEQDRLAESGDSDRGTVGRGGPLYRIRVTRLSDGEASRSMEALVRVSARTSDSFSILWRRFGMISDGAQVAAGGAAEGTESF